MGFTKEVADRVLFVDGGLILEDDTPWKGIWCSNKWAKQNCSCRKFYNNISNIKGSEFEIQSSSSLVFLKITNL